MTLTTTGLILLALLGLVNTAFLHWQYRQFLLSGRPIVCLVGSNCQMVVASIYGRTWGVKNELFGLVYYGVILTLAVGLPGWQFTPGLVAIITALGVAFSTVLLYLQAAVLRRYCSWCLLAILINYALFGLAWPRG